jgi:hypothetical protein
MDKLSSDRSIYLPRELKWFLAFSAFLWLLSSAFIAHHVYRYPKFPHGLPVPFYNAPFSDLNAFNGKLYMIHDPQFFVSGYKWIYPAPCIFLYKLILHFNHYTSHRTLFGDITYLLMILVGLSALAAGTAKAFTRRGLPRTSAYLVVVLTVILSWPILVAVHTGNIEAILWIGAAFAVWAYYREMWWTAAIAIGAVSAFKIYPLLLLGLLLVAGKVRQVAIGILTFATITVAGLAYIGPTIPVAYHSVADGVESFTDLAFYPGNVDRDYLTLEHSVVSLIRICTSDHPRLMLLLFHYYIPVAGGLMAVLFFTRVWQMPRLNQLLVVTLAAVMLPPKSYDYTLELLYIPWAWLALLAVSAAARGSRIRGIMPAMLCLALILSPECFITFRGVYSFGQFKAIILLVLLWVAVHYRFEDRLDEFGAGVVAYPDHLAHRIPS